MQFRNPWIDPRICKVHSADVQQYLVRNGWQSQGCDRPNLVPFTHPNGMEQGPTIYLPTDEHSRDYLQCLVEAITDLAYAENRYAGEVLDEILVEDSVSLA